MKRFLYTFLALVLPLSGFAQLDAGQDTTICNGNSVTLGASANTTGVTFSGLSTLSLSDDSYSATINIGFPFTFYGNAYSQCLISSNNYITFDLSNASGYSPWGINSAIPDPGLPTNAIMCPYQDINPGAGGVVEYGTVGTAPNRIFVVRYFQVPMFSCTQLSFCSAIFLYENGNIIETHIENKPLCSTWNGGVAIHGLHNNNGTLADVVPGRNYPTQWTTSLEGTSFTPNGINAYTIATVPFQAVVSNNNIDWYNGATLVGTGDSITVSPSTTTTYTAQLAFCDGTVWSDDVTVSIASALNFATNTTPTACSAPTGTGTVTPSGGSGFYSYDWSPGGYTDSLVTGLGEGTYNVLVTDTVNGCASNVSLSIVENNTIDVVVDSIYNASCNNGNDGQIFVSGVNGAGNYTYQWNDPMLQTDSNATGLSIGTYQVVITDADGCMDSTTATITQPTPVVLAVGGTTDVSCNGGSDGTATIAANGGTPTYTYVWNDPSNQTTNPAVGLPAGTYTVTVTDAQGCSETISVTITEPGPLSATEVSAVDVSCNGGSDGSGQVAGVGGTSPYTYEWVGLGVFSSDAYNLPAGDYDVIVTDAQGCTTTITVTITDPAPASVATSTTEATCGVNDGSATASASGGASPYSYQWDATAGGQTSQTATNLGAGTYNVTVTDANGCVTTGTAVVTDTLDIAASFTATPEVGVAPLDVSFNSTTTGNPVSYEWDYGNGVVVSSSSGSSNYTYTNPGTYIVTLTVFNAGGCTSVFSVTVIVNEESSLSVPNVFTPNGDGYNDEFKVTYEAITEFHCEIYNRWGKKVYEYSDVTGSWDGGKNNEGTYYYVITAKGDDDQEYSLSGNVTLLLNP